MNNSVIKWLLEQTIHGAGKMMRFRKTKLLFVVTFFLLSHTGAAAPRDEPQPPAFEKPKNYSQSRFIFKIYNHAPQNRALSQIDLHWGFVNDLFQFVKVDHEFVAGFDLNVELFDAAENFIESKFVTRKIAVTAYEKTNSNRISNQGKFTFIARPGEYQIRIELVDRDTKKSLTRKQEVTFQDFSAEKLALSDLFFVQKLEDSVSVWQNHPNPDANFSDSASVWLAFYEIYPAAKVDSVVVLTRITDVHDREVFADTESVHMTAPSQLRKVNLHSVLRHPGRFILTVQVRGQKMQATGQQHFFLTQASPEPYISLVDDILEPLQVIGNPAELKKIENVDEAGKRRLIAEFWKKRDPTPETEANEIKIEFYRRVEFCYKNFTVHFADKPGWKTDRGRVFLRFGEPSLVQKYSSEINRPATEIWYYDSLHQRFMFVDKHGTGDFGLSKIE
jgi:GWxTD domain-containing protein